MGQAASSLGIGIFGAALTIAAAPALAEDSTPALSLELNALQPSDKGCRLTFLVTNGLGGDLTRASFEIPLFDKEGVIDRLKVLDFKDLSVGKTKVSRFDLAGTDCAKVSRVLINSVTECKGAGIEPDACIRRLKAETKAHIKFGI